MYIQVTQATEWHIKNLEQNLKYFNEVLIKSWSVSFSSTVAWKTVNVAKSVAQCPG